MAVVEELVNQQLAPLQQLIQRKLRQARSLAASGAEQRLVDQLTHEIEAMAGAIEAFDLLKQTYLNHLIQRTEELDAVSTQLRLWMYLEDLSHDIKHQTGTRRPSAAGRNQSVDDIQRECDRLDEEYAAIVGQW